LAHLPSFFAHDWLRLVVDLSDLNHHVLFVAVWDSARLVVSYHHMVVVPARRLLALKTLRVVWILEVAFQMHCLFKVMNKHLREPGFLISEPTWFASKYAHHHVVGAIQQWFAHLRFAQASQDDRGFFESNTGLSLLRFRIEFTKELVFLAAAVQHQDHTDVRKFVEDELFESLLDWIGVLELRFVESKRNRRV
jgi:hypothetical protein